MNKNWINAKNQLPKNDEDVLVYLCNTANDIDTITVGYYDQNKKWYSNDDVELEDYGFFVYHWQNLPPKPKMKSVKNKNTICKKVNTDIIKKVNN